MKPSRIQSRAASYRAQSFAYLAMVADKRNPAMSRDLVRSYGRGLRKAAREAGFRLP